MRLPETPLSCALFAPESGKRLRCYAVIDGAACEELLPKIEELSPEYCCLYAGELEPDLEEVAPYLVGLNDEHPFTAWLIESIGSKPWGIFCRADADLRAMRKHFRQFLMVKGPDGKNLYFRYYDPRVLGVFFETCDAGELASVYGLAEEFVFHNSDGKLVRWVQ